MFPILPLLLAGAALGGTAMYGEYQRKRGAKKANAANAAAATAASADSNKALEAARIDNTYNYNGLNNSNLGQTLFQQDEVDEFGNPIKRRTIFN